MFIALVVAIVLYCIVTVVVVIEQWLLHNKKQSVTIL